MRRRWPITRRLRLQLLAAAIVTGVLTIGWKVPRAGSLSAVPGTATGPLRPYPLRGDALPPTLSETGLFTDLAELRAAGDLVPYELNVPFWSDGAAKRRWFRLPPGAKMQAREEGSWALPAGTVLVKHFELGTDAVHQDASRRLETRVLVVAVDGTVDGATYRWRSDRGDADIVYARSVEQVDLASPDGARQTFPWHYMPGFDCRTCHTPQAGGALGINTAQLNRDVVASGAIVNQLSLWRGRGWLVETPDPALLPRLPALDDASVPIESRARAWLSVNCAQCHAPGGAPTEFDLRYSTPLERQGLVDGRARIDLGIDNAKALAPNDPWRSLILHRVENLDGNRMPPLAHERVDEQGRALLREWIASLPGAPVLSPPTILRAADRMRVPLSVTIEHPDSCATIRYTLDGSAPTGTSPVYAGPIHLEKPTTLRARAYRDGHTRSIATQQTFTR